MIFRLATVYGTSLSVTGNNNRFATAQMIFSRYGFIGETQSEGKFRKNIDLSLFLRS